VPMVALSTARLARPKQQERIARLAPQGVSDAT
jgi:hypothetical protein